MYSWGPNTSDWHGRTNYNYSSENAPYLDELAAESSSRGERTYSRRTSPDVIVKTKDKTIKTESENPIVVGIDVTGSMSRWPAEIFDRLPLMYQTLSQYRQDVEISFGAIGDAYSDRYPLQANDFGHGIVLEDHVNALCPEGGGGGQVSETYELFAYFMLEKCKMSNAQSPFMFIFGDEKFYNEVNPAQVEHYIGDNLENPMASGKVWQKLIEKFNLYFLQKPYGSGHDRRMTAEIKQHWANAIGEQRIVDLPNAERAVDIAIGIVARHWGQYGDFRENLSARQSDEVVRNQVHDAVRDVREDVAESVDAVASASEKPISLHEKYGER